MTGVIKRLVTDHETGKPKGFGFIRADGEPTEYFFHHSSLEQTTRRWEELREGDRVAFSPIAGPVGKGPRAIEVRVIT